MGAVRGKHANDVKRRDKAITNRPAKAAQSINLIGGNFCQRAAYHINAKLWTRRSGARRA